MPLKIDWSQVPDTARRRLSLLADMVEAEKLVVTPGLRQEARSAITDLRVLVVGDPDLMRALACVRSAGIVLAGVASIGSDAELARQNCIEALRLLTDAFRRASQPEAPALNLVG